MRRGTALEHSASFRRAEDVFETAEAAARDGDDAAALSAYGAAVDLYASARAADAAGDGASEAATVIAARIDTCLSNAQRLSTKLRGFGDRRGGDRDARHAAPHDAVSAVTASCRLCGDAFALELLDSHEAVCSGSRAGAIDVGVGGSDDHSGGGRGSRGASDGDEGAHASAVPGAAAGGVVDDGAARAECSRCKAVFELSVLDSHEATCGGGGADDDDAVPAAGSSAGAAELQRSPDRSHSADRADRRHSADRGRHGGHSASRSPPHARGAVRGRRSSAGSHLGAAARRPGHAAAGSRQHGGARGGGAARRRSPGAGGGGRRGGSSAAAGGAKKPAYRGYNIPADAAAAVPVAGARRTSSGRGSGPSAGAAAGAGRGAGRGGSRASSSSSHANPADPPKRKKIHAEGKLEEALLDEVLDASPGVRWDDVAGLELAKRTLQEAIVLPAQRPDIFKGLRAPPRGVLLFGPPGTGKTLLAKAVATESSATFFSISAAALTSKWVGEGEKIVRALFSLARKAQPAVIFMDEIDSVLTKRSSGEHEASRRLKTEFMVQLDGAGTSDDTEERIVVIGATNRPQELDDAVLRRLVKRVYIPLPDAPARKALLERLLKGVPSEAGCEDAVVAMTEGYSGSDLKALSREAAMVPVRALGARIARAAADEVADVTAEHFRQAMSVIRPSVAPETLGAYEAWSEAYGVVGV